MQIPYLLANKGFLFVFYAIRLLLLFGGSHSIFFFIGRIGCRRFNSFFSLYGWHLFCHFLRLRRIDLQTVLCRTFRAVCYRFGGNRNGVNNLFFAFWFIFWFPNETRQYLFIWIKCSNRRIASLGFTDIEYFGNLVVIK